MHISGAHYLGSRFDFSFSESSVSIRVTGQDGFWVPPLEVQLWPSQARFPLPPGRQVLPAQSRVQYLEDPPPHEPLGQPLRTPLLAGHTVSFPCSAGRIQRSLPGEAAQPMAP